MNATCRASWRPPSPRDLAALGLIGQKRFSEQEWREITQEEQQLRAESGVIAAAVIR
jgi:hypothetical protein